jgi:hypothetical protein
MQHKIILKPGFSSPAVEALLTDAANTVTDYVKVQAKHDCQKEPGISEPAFKITILDFIQAKIQQVIDGIRQNLLVASRIMQVREFEITAKKQCEKNKAEIVERELQIKELERKKQLSTPDQQKMKSRVWLPVVAISVAIADAAVANNSFRQAGYSVILALLASAAIFGVISILNLIVAPWINNAPGKAKKVLRGAIILITGFLFFLSIANLRATGLNNLIDTAIHTSAMPESNLQVSVWPICLVSFGLFATVFFASIFFWQGKEEKTKAEQYKKLHTQITLLQQEVTTLQQETGILESDILTQKDEARELFDYYKKTILRIKNTGTFSVTLYKKTYASFTATIPGFFSDKQDFIYDEEINFFNPEKQEL